MGIDWNQVGAVRSGMFTENGQNANPHYLLLNGLIVCSCELKITNRKKEMENVLKIERNLE